MTMDSFGHRLRHLFRFYLDAGPRRRRQMVLLGVLVVMLLCVSSVWVYYLRTREPLPAALPPAPIVEQIFQPHYLSSIYDVQRPVGVATTPRGDRVYVTESDGERFIKAFDREGSFLFAFAPPDSNPAERAPVYATVAPDGRLYVSDRRHHTVHIYDAQGNHEGTFDPPNGEGSWAPLGLAFAEKGLYITDVTKGRHRILAYSWRGQLQSTFGQEGKEPGQFWFPNAVEVDDKGQIYVSDSNNGRLQVFDQKGKLLYAMEGFSLPRGMALDDQGHLFVVDAVGQKIHAYGVNDGALTQLYEFGDVGLGDGQFNYPNDIAVDQTGRLYIADRENNRVQVWSF